MRSVSYLPFEQFLRTLNPWHRRKMRRLAEDLAASRSVTTAEALEQIRESYRRR